MRVFLIASSVFREEHQEFLASRNLTWRETSQATAGQRLIEFAGRVCYLSFGNSQSPKSNSEYVRHVIAQGHESVLEHSSYSLLVDEISRGLSHQLVRHRAGFAFSQLSQQYRDETDARFVVPVGVPGSSVVDERWRLAMESAIDAYRGILEALSSSSYAAALDKKERSRAIRSIARSVLPNATSTTLVMTGNARAWRHVLSVRGAIEGDLEMREFCLNVLRLLQPEAPDVFQDFEVAEDALGPLVIKKT